MPTVADVIGRTLQAHRTEVFFCVTGGDHALWNALSDAGIRIISCRSESAAVYMADGYARVTGRPGFVYGQKGPGAANVAAALADPFWAGSPVVSLTSSSSLAVRDRRDYQELDALALHAPLTKWCKGVVNPARAGMTLQAAIQAATTPTPGPVHIEFPQDILTSPSNEGAPEAPVLLASVGQLRARPDPEIVAAAVKALHEAERPLILAGTGVMMSEAWTELTAFAEALSIPVVTSLGGKGSIAENSELSAGNIGRYSRKVANEVVENADVLLVIGSRLGGLVTNGWGINLSARIIQIDTDANCFNLNYPTEISILADAKAALSNAVAMVSALHYQRKQLTPWARDVAERVAAWRAKAAALRDEIPEDGIHPAIVMSALRDVLRPDDIVASDTGSTAAWTGALYPVAAGRNYIPAALGAALARPNRRTVAVSGDGGMGYHIGELETALRCSLPVVLLVMNNRCYASEYHAQRYRWKRVIPEVCDFVDVNYAEIAKGYGAFGVRVEEARDVPDALATALADGRPALVEVLISKEVIAPVAGYDKILGREV
jgi:acetolactate synthase I/II/III large subunit